MPAFKDRSSLAGTKYGRLTLQAEYKRNVNGRIVWKFSCDCGNETWASFDDVRRGRPKTCGCSKKSSHNRLEKGLAAKRELFRIYRKGAVKRKLDFRLSFQEFIELTSDICTYCGRGPTSEMPRAKFFGSYRYNGIDRIDSSSGYTVSNSQTCCAECNRAKWTASHDEFIEQIKRRYEWVTRSMHA